MSFEQVTFTPRYPAFGYFLTAEAEFKVLEYKDHMEVWRSDSRGRWRRRKTMPKELTAMYKTYRSYDLMAIPSAPEGHLSEVSRWSCTDAGEVRDPAFIERESNPVVKIRSEDGEVIWADG